MIGFHSIIATRITRETTGRKMDKKLEQAKENALVIQKQLRSLGANRSVALSVHVTKATVAELEERIANLIAQLDDL